MVENETLKMRFLIQAMKRNHAQVNYLVGSRD